VAHPSMEHNAANEETVRFTEGGGKDIGREFLSPRWGAGIPSGLAAPRQRRRGKRQEQLFRFIPYRGWTDGCDPVNQSGGPRSERRCEHVLGMIAAKGGPLA
jgi:hypothetical protein